MEPEQSTRNVTRLSDSGSIRSVRNSLRWVGEALAVLGEQRAPDQGRHFVLAVVGGREHPVGVPDDLGRPAVSRRCRRDAGTFVIGVEEEGESSVASVLAGFIALGGCRHQIADYGGNGQGVRRVGLLIGAVPPQPGQVVAKPGCEPEPRRLDQVLRLGDHRFSGDAGAADLGDREEQDPVRALGMTGAVEPQ